MDWVKIGKECIQTAIKALVELKEVKALDNEINIQTDADILSHKTIREYLTRSGIACNLVSEESDKLEQINDGDNNIEVVIDPIDYTQMFLRGELSFCSIGMLVLINRLPKYSFVGDISNNDIYYCDEISAYKNDKQLKVPEVIQGKNLILSWSPHKKRLDRYVQALSDLTADDGEYMIYNFGGLLQAAKIADGRFDACVEVKPCSLHEFASAPIVQRAGGIVSTLEGTDIIWDPAKKQTLLISRNQKIHDDILQRFRDN